MRGRGVHSAIEDSARRAQTHSILGRASQFIKTSDVAHAHTVGPISCCCLGALARSPHRHSTHGAADLHRASTGRDRPSLGSPRAVRQSHPRQRCKDGEVRPSQPLGKTRRRTVRSRVLPPRRPVAHRTHGSRGTGEPATSQPVRISSRRSRFPSKSTGKSVECVPHALTTVG